MSTTLIGVALDLLGSLSEDGLLKNERIITGPQSSEINTRDAAGTHHALNMCANNYLGLADHPKLIDAAKWALDSHGFGMASVRFICGTQDLHKKLEQRIASFLKLDDAILFSSCFDANAGVFEALLGSEDAIISDALNHASIIDGVRLCKAQRFRYANNDMAALEACLQEASGARLRMIVTDGVFSMDGIIANLAMICDLAEKYDATVLVDDSHAVGFMGSRGAGTPDHCGVEGRVTLLTGTLGKALGGASGGYVAGPKAVIDVLRQKARPYLFSNALAPPICAASLAALDLVEDGEADRARLTRNAARFRNGMEAAGFDLIPGEHPIIPVMIGDAKLATEMADLLMQEGIYVTAFSYPVVPKGAARIRTQMSAAHSERQIDAAVAAFIKVACQLERTSSAGERL